MLITSDRLPTVSASDALKGLQNDASKFVPSGVPTLDSLLSGPGLENNGGFERGKVTMIWGASGSGKTAIM